MKIPEKYQVKDIPKDQTYEWVLRKHYNRGVGAIPTPRSKYLIYNPDML